MKSVIRMVKLPPSVMVFYAPNQSAEIDFTMLKLEKPAIQEKIPALVIVIALYLHAVMGILILITIISPFLISLIERSAMMEIS